MKLNWGQGLLIAIITGVLGIILLVVLSSREKIDLVTREYYPEGLEYEQQIQKLKNTTQLPQQIQIIRVNKLVQICFPKTTSHIDDYKGKIWFYFPADINRDHKMDVQLDSVFCQFIPIHHLSTGKYDVIIEWTDGEKEYFHREQLYIE